MKLKINNSEYEFDFDEMTQTNASTQKKRKIDRIILSDTIFNIKKVLWKVKLETGNFTDYEDIANCSIKRAYCAKKPTFDITIAEKNYTLDFKAMIQINKSTNFKRNIRRDVVYTKGDAIWVWLNDKDIYSPYDISISETIETQFQAGTSRFTMKVGNCDYDVDFSKLVQVNKETNKSRNIRRILAEQIFAPDKLPPLTAVWKWNSNNSFVEYKTSNIKLIENAYQDKQTSLKLNIANMSYTIDFTAMMQINDSTNMKRKICRIPYLLSQPTLPFKLISSPSLPETSQVIWEYLSDNGYKPYNSVILKQIETSFQAMKPSCNFSFNSYDYNLNFSTMKQTNLKTNMARTVRRTPNVATTLWECETDNGYVK